jgi:very-short-patch-repair endonuclease
MKRNPDSVRRARENRANMPKAEAQMWSLLRDRRLVARKFRRQHTIGIYAVDFACAAVKLVIELDGPLHGEPEQIAFDEQRTEYLRLNGWRVLRFKNDGCLPTLAPCCVGSLKRLRTLLLVKEKVARRAG